MSVEIQSAYMIHPRMTHSLPQLSVQSPALFMVHSELRYVDVTAARVLPALEFAFNPPSLHRSIPPGATTTIIGSGP
jgi:hypothetical protein